MDIVQSSLQGLVPFLMYFVSAVIAAGIFAKVYSLVTPHNEVELIKENNAAAATAYVGALLGFAIPLYSALSNSVSVIDFVVWAGVALVIQVVTFWVVRKFFYPLISERIEKGEIAAAIKLAGVAIVIGLLNAGSMTY